MSGKNFRQISSLFAKIKNGFENNGIFGCGIFRSMHILIRYIVYVQPMCIDMWRSREYIVLMGYFGYCGSFVLQPQCVTCSVAGVIS